MRPIQNSGEIHSKEMPGILVPPGLNWSKSNDSRKLGTFRTKIFVRSCRLIGFEEGSSTTQSSRILKCSGKPPVLTRAVVMNGVTQAVASAGKWILPETCVRLTPAFPQGLKPSSLFAMDGTAEAVPLQNRCPANCAEGRVFFFSCQTGFGRARGCGCWLGCVL